MIPKKNPVNADPDHSAECGTGLGTNDWDNRKNQKTNFWERNHC